MVMCMMSHKLANTVIYNDARMINIFSCSMLSPGVFRRSSKNSIQYRRFTYTNKAPLKNKSWQDPDAIST